MAGLQYNFFPTDFLYPKPTKKIADVTTPQVIATNNQRPKVSGDDLTIMKSSVPVKNQIRTLKLLSSSSFDF
ncbi:hypothetical protein SSX86_023790 [Deinandra increscens subsp. villosa]|uniref:Uncharacterized protein n=1 Tax=Deinandra increscens subsp. villosa TaxID=3103831 RepID=A0AAP0GQ96_9ASTR